MFVGTWIILFHQLYMLSSRYDNMLSSADVGTFSHRPGPLLLLHIAKDQDMYLMMMMLMRSMMYMILAVCILILE